jgi:DNA-directed RNA polymerase specialized sigma24 family protein
MDRPDSDTRLNQIATLWTQVRRAHDDPGSQGRAAREALLERYGGAIKKYLLGALRDPHAAEELAQDFAVKFLNGNLKGADPTRGRFRDFVKGVLFHLVADYHHKRRRDPNPLPTDAPEPGADCAVAAERDRAFLESWRDELLGRAWDALQRHQDQTGQPYYSVLHFRADHPDDSSAEMAEKFSARVGRPINAPAFRKALDRARDKFGDLLLDEIAQAIENPSRAALEDELSDLRLLEYCRSALERRAP